MADTNTPSQYFSRLPSEFVRDWLPAKVGNLGWPPETRLQGWTKVLGDSPERWRFYQWSECLLDLNTTNWRPDTETTVNGLLDACFKGISNSWARFANQSNNKIQRIQSYAMTRHMLPSRLLVAKTSTGLFLVDGCHRVAWFRYSSSMLGSVFPVSSIAKCYLGKYEKT